MTVQRPAPHEIFEYNPTIPPRTALHVAHKRLTHRELCWFVLDKNPEKYGPGALRWTLHLPAFSWMFLVQMQAVDSVIICHLTDFHFSPDFLLASAASLARVRSGTCHRCLKGFPRSAKGWSNRIQQATSIAAPLCQNDREIFFPNSLFVSARGICHT
jgi:hypothetical protein